MAPAGPWDPGDVNGFNDPTTICSATPAAMNSPTPLPNPHFDTTSSRNIINIPPMVICSINIHANPGSVAGNAPVSTSTDASNIVNMIARSFWVPWNIALSSGFERSKFIIFPPTNSCSMIDAETMGPIPKVIIEPKLPASTARSYANWSTAVGLRPNKLH